MRLIDADRLQAHFEEAKKKTQNLFGVAKILEVQATIDAQPTAYDVENVVEQLEEAIADTTDTETGLGARWAYTGAIEIVKQGGVSDDVCEWKQEDDNLITSCGDYFNILDNCTEKFDFCPKCGKKIKVVE